MSSFVQKHVTSNDFILFLHNNQTRVGRILARSFPINQNDLLVLMYISVPPRLHATGQTSLFGSNEVQPTDEQIHISSNVIIDFAFVFDINAISLDRKIHLHGISNAYFIDSSTLLIPFHPFINDFSLPKIIFGSFQNIVRLNDQIMNNRRQFQKLVGKLSCRMEDIVWCYIIGKLQSYTHLFNIAFKTFSRLCRWTHWDFKRETVSSPFRYDIITTTSAEGYNLLREMFGSSIGFGIRDKPPRIADRYRTLQHQHDIINYVADVSNEIQLSFIHELNIFPLKIHYTRGSMSHPSVQNFVNNRRLWYLDTVRSNEMLIDNN